MAAESEHREPIVGAHGMCTETITKSAEAVALTGVVSALL